MTKKKRIIITIVSCLLTYVIVPILFPSLRYGSALRTQPEISDLVGEWVGDKESKTILEKNITTSPFNGEIRLTLFEGGKFNAQNLPINTFSKTAIVNYNGQGDWQIQKIYSAYAIVFSTNSNEIQYYINKQNNKYGLTTNIEGPDAGIIVLLIKARE